MSPNSYGFGARDGLDAGGVVARVVAAEAAFSQRPEQVAQRAIAEKIQALVGDLEACRWRIGAEPAARTARLALRALGLQIGRRRDEPFLHHAIDDVLNQLLELRSRIGLIGVSRIAQQPFERFLRQHAAVEQRVHDGVVQRLHRAIVFRLPVHAAVGRLEAARQQKIRQLLDQVIEIQIVQRIAGVFGVLVTHVVFSSQFSVLSRQWSSVAQLTTET